MNLVNFFRILNFPICQKKKLLRNAESFCEETLSCASSIVTYLHTSVSHEGVRIPTMLRMNESLMEYMSAEYDNLHSRIEVSETHITKELRDKTEQQTRESTVMDDV